MHIYVCPLAIPMSAHYILLSCCLMFFHAYGNLFWKSYTDFLLIYCGSCLSEVVHHQNLSATHHVKSVFTLFSISVPPTCLFWDCASLLAIYLYILLTNKLKRERSSEWKTENSREGNLMHKFSFAGLQCYKIKHILWACPAVCSCMKLNRTPKGGICSAFCEIWGLEYI